MNQGIFLPPYVRLLQFPAVGSSSFFDSRPNAVQLLLFGIHL